MFSQVDEVLNSSALVGSAVVGSAVVGSAVVRTSLVDSSLVTRGRKKSDSGKHPASFKAGLDS